MTWLIAMILKYALPSVLGDLSSDIVTELGALLQTEIARRQALAEGGERQAAAETASSARVTAAEATASAQAASEGVDVILAGHKL